MSDFYKRYKVMLESHHKFPENDARFDPHIKSSSEAIQTFITIDFPQLKKRYTI